MSVLIVVASALILLFGFVIWMGAPYVPTLRLQINTSLDMFDFKPGQTLLELGSGDGRVARAAAQRGLYVTGIEINPLLVLYSKLITWRYRKQVTIIWGNIWTQRWPEEADGIYTFLLDRFMPKLDKKITQTYNNKNIKLVSFAFEMPARHIVTEKNGVFLYQYKKS